MKIAWLAINASYSHASLAAPLLERAARAIPNLQWDLVRHTIHDDPQTVAARVIRGKPDLLAVSLYLFNRAAVRRILLRIRVLLPRCLIIAGGPECLGDHRKLLDAEPWLDLAVRGEGEEALVAILERARNGRDFRGIAGVTWRNTAGGDIHEAPDTAVCASWTALPSPCASPLFSWDRPFVQIETARGCAFSCTYCSSCRSAPVRHRPLETLKAEIDCIARHGIREIRVLDRTFNATPNRAGELLELFRQFPRLTFHVEMHPALLPAALRRQLAAAPPGNLHVEAGLQSTCVPALEAVRRSGNVEAALDGIRFLVSCDERFETHVDLLAGLPKQCLDHVLADVRVLMQIGPREIQLEILKALPGTPFREQAADFDIRYSPDPPYEVLATPTLPPADLLEVARLSRLVDRFYNAAPLQQALRLAVKRRKTTLETLLEYCRRGQLLEAPISLRNRFVALYRFLEPACPEAAEALQIEWMRHGLSPQHGICRATRWTGAIPAEAERVDQSGQSSPADPPEGSVRTWHLSLAREEYWFTYRRHGKNARATAIHRRDIAG